MFRQMLGLVAIALVFPGLSAERRDTEQVPSEVRETEALAERIGCRNCHSPDRKLIGPTLQDIASRYKQDAGARETLIRKVKVGGKGNWTELTGGVPMPPHAGLLNDQEISRLVDWILGRTR